MTRSFPLAAFASAFAGAVALAPALGAQSAPRVGTVVIAHGGDSLWNSHVIEAARAARTDGPLEISVLMGPAAKRALLIVGHGPNTAEENAAWMENLRPIAERVKQMTGFRDVRVHLVRDDAPAPVRAEAVRHVRELIELQHAMTGADVLVVPVLVSKGMVSRDKVPADLRGTPHIYAGEPLLPHPAMVRWIEARAAGR